MGVLGIVTISPHAEATVYDRPLLQYNLLEREAECAAITDDRRRLHDEDDAELREVGSVLVRVSIPGTPETRASAHRKRRSVSQAPSSWAPP